MTGGDAHGDAHSARASFVTTMPTTTQRASSAPEPAIPGTNDSATPTKPASNVPAPAPTAPRKATRPTILNTSLTPVELPLPPPAPAGNRAVNKPAKSPGAPAQVITAAMELTSPPLAREPGDLQANRGSVSTEGQGGAGEPDISIPLQTAIATFYSDLEQCKNKRYIQAIKDAAAQHVETLKNPGNTLEQKLQALTDFTNEYEAIKVKDHTSHKSAVNFISRAVAIVLSATLAAGLAFLGALWTGPGAIIIAVAAAFIAVGATRAALEGADRLAENSGKRRLGLFKPVDESIANLRAALEKPNDDMSPSARIA
jgi:hypothetical protein